MHVAFWSPGWPLKRSHNGIVTYVDTTKRALEGQGHRVSVFTGYIDQSDYEPGVYHVRRPPWDRLLRRVRRLRYPREHEMFNFAAVIAAHILRVHRRDPIDIIEMEESFGWCADVARLTHLPVIVKLHGPAFLSLTEDELQTPLGCERVDREGWALRRSPVIVSPTRATLIQTIERYRLTPKEGHHIVYPLTMDADTPLWRLEACDRDTILFVGRFDLRKGADVVLKAFRSILKDRADLKLVFVGPDRGLPAPDGTLLHFHSYCDSLFPKELRDRVDFRGAMPNRDIADLRAKAAVTVIGSRWENQGYALLEAMYQGCPIVSTDAGGCPESVSHGITGRLARSEDSEDFASQLRATLANPELAQAMGQAARRHVLEQHSIDAVATATLKLYETVISQHD
jgi:glycosyltransferase involved in cell wall biosynthesis